MKKKTLPNAPARRFGDYELEGFTPPRFARVIYQLIESKPDRKVIEAQAFEVDALGALVPYETGAPSRTPGTTHTIAASGMGDTHTLAPGWVRVVPPSGTTWTLGDTAMPRNLPEGCEPVDALPEVGVEGQQVFFNEQVMAWSLGVVETILRGKAEELAGILRNAEQLGDLNL